jgi:aminopeptidase N
LFLIDQQSATYLLANMAQIRDPLTRGAAWVTLWDNVLEGRVDAGALIDAALVALSSEGDEQNTQRILGYVSNAYWRLLSQDQRLARAPALEAALRAGLGRAGTTSLKSAWFSAFRDDVLTSDGVAWLERVWRRDERIPGLTFAETDEIAMATELAVREVPNWQQILQMQLDRTENPDRKARFAFVMPALSADPQVRGQAFERFRSLDNRRREPWVLESMSYLNHPLREADSFGPASNCSRRSSAPVTSSFRDAGWTRRSRDIARRVLPLSSATSSRRSSSIPSVCAGRC